MELLNTAKSNYVLKVDRLKSQVIMETITACTSIEELDNYLKMLKERVTLLSVHEAGMALRCGYNKLSKEWPLLFRNVRQHLLSYKSIDEVENILRGLDKLL